MGQSEPGQKGDPIDEKVLVEVVLTYVASFPHCPLPRSWRPSERDGGSPPCRNYFDIGAYAVGSPGSAMPSPGPPEAAFSFVPWSWSRSCESGCNNDPIFDAFSHLFQDEPLQSFDHRSFLYVGMIPLVVGYNHLGSGCEGKYREGGKGKKPGGEETTQCLSAWRGRSTGSRLVVESQLSRESWDCCAVSSSLFLRSRPGNL